MALAVERLAALAPGDLVLIEFVRDYRRLKHVTGMVVRLVGSRIVVSCRSDCGVSYVHEFGRRDGMRIGSGSRAELVAAGTTEPTSVQQRRQAARVDAPYIEWGRNRDDVCLGVLREVMDRCLEKPVPTR